MSTNQVFELGRDTLTIVLLLALPALGVSLLVGLVVSVFQTITSIQDQTLSFVPRIIAVGAVVIFTLTWMLQTAIHYTVRMLEHAVQAVR